MPAYMGVTEFTVAVGDRQITCALAAPESDRASEDSGLLLNVSATRHYALFDPSQNHPTKPFLDAGHYVLSFDLPHHGEHKTPHSDPVSEGQANGEIQNMGKAFASGDDPFEQFVAYGMAALDACRERGVGGNGKTVAYGVSRAGYCCLRLAAADRRVRAVAAVSPVTDWALLPQFATYCDDQSLKQLRIYNWADQLADRAVHLSVGSQDDVVGADSCVRFATELFEKQRATLPDGTLLNQLHVVDSPGHSPAERWRLDATDFLLRFCAQS